jgi:hypothetical protein
MKEFTVCVPRYEVNYNLNSQWGLVTKRQWLDLEACRLRAKGITAVVDLTPAGWCIMVPGDPPRVIPRNKILPTKRKHRRTREQVWPDRADIEAATVRLIGSGQITGSAQRPLIGKDSRPNTTKAARLQNAPEGTLHRQGERESPISGHAISEMGCSPRASAARSRV